MTRFFKRQISLTVGDPQDPKNALGLDSFDCTFQIEKSLSEKTPNTLDLRVYNLSKDHRDALAKPKLVTVMIKAGYGEETDVKTLPLLFYGDVRNVFSQIDGPDWITYITSGDGEIVNREARVSQAFSSGTYYKDVISKVLDQIDAAGVKTGNARKSINDPAVNAGLNKKFIKGTTITGGAFDQLGKLIRPCGMECSIQDLEVQILKAGSASSPDAVLLSPMTGLIGSPQRDLDKILKARSLLNGDIKPGRMLQIDSSQFKGFYRVDKATYIGDKSGSDWFVDIEGKEVTLRGAKA